jgi:hypothetical protein
VGLKSPSVDVRLLGLLGTYHQHAISTFNTWSWGLTHRSLTDTGGGYNLEGTDFPHTTPRPSQPTVSLFHLRVPSDIRLSIIHQLDQSFKFKEPMAAMWSFDHSAIYRGLLLCLAIANNISLALGFTRIDRRDNLMQLGHQSNSYNLMHTQESQIAYKGKQKSRTVVRCTRACLDHNNVSILATWHLWSSEHLLDLLHLNFRLWLHVIYQICKRWSQLNSAMCGVQSVIWCMIKSILLILIHKSHFTNLPLAFLLI